MLERAAWQLRQGASVTDTAFAAGYESVEGFSRAFARAFGHPPSALARRPAATGCPRPTASTSTRRTSLWVHAKEQPMNPLTEQLVAARPRRHPAAARGGQAAADEDYRRPQLPGQHGARLRRPGRVGRPACSTHLVFTKEVWVAAIEGTDFPRDRADDVGDAGRAARGGRRRAGWRSVRDIDRRGAWDDRLIDALCDPPESFVLGSVVAHVLTYSAHRGSWSASCSARSGTRSTTATRSTGSAPARRAAEVEVP